MFHKTRTRFCYNKNMASRIKYWEQSEQLVKLRGYMRRGLSLNDTALKMGVSAATLRQWIKESPTIRENLTKFASNVDLYAIEDKLVTAARQGHAWAVNRYLDAFGGERYNPDMRGEFMPNEDNNETFNEIVDIIEGEWKGDKK